MTNDERLGNLAVSTNSQSTVMTIMGTFTRQYDQTQFDFSTLTIIGWYDNNGVAITNWSTAANISILKTVQDGIVADCRPPHVKFVKVRNECNFSGQVTIHNQQVTILPSEYFMGLYQSTKPVTGGGGQICQVTTWLGAADLSTLTPEEMSSEILDKTFQTCPVLLKRPALNLDVEI